MALEGLESLASIFVSGNGPNDKFVQSFWSEDLFNPQVKVRYHWLKLFWVYGISFMLQYVLLAAVLAFASTLYHNGGSDWTWAIYMVMGAALLAWIWAPVLAGLTIYDLRRLARRQALEGKDKPETKIAISQVDTPIEEEDDPIIGDQWKLPKK